MMGEPREIRVEDTRWVLHSDGRGQRYVPVVDDWGPVASFPLLREVARLRDENRRLREEGIRDAIHILFNECEWIVDDGRTGVMVYFPPGFTLPEHDEEQTISRTAMADALTYALLPLVP
jgi:hypothetical protein